MIWTMGINELNLSVYIHVSELGHRYMSPKGTFCDTLQVPSGAGDM